MNGLLIVDDEEGVRRSLNRALQREGYSIFLASNGNEAIRIVHDNIDEIAIIISDLKMPGLDGIETLKAVGNLNPEITRIVLTGYGTMETAIEATNEGIDGYLTKPFDNVEIRAKIREYFLKKHLKQFVSSQILQELQKNPTTVRPRKQKTTILFTDIRGFCSISERIDPQDLAVLLNRHYFTPFGDIIFKYNGTVDKHIGDSIMVIYGAPVSYGDDALRAVLTAVEMQKTIAATSVQLGSSDLMPIPVGIGISTGEVVAGIFGSARKKEYTALGSAVNIAARLEKIAKGGQILITDETFQEVRNEIEVEELDTIYAKGIERKIRIYNILGVKSTEFF
ncbi:MAG: adenylate/guanylate cyclase domain-containing protein [Pseudomonadota bacterium]